MTDESTSTLIRRRIRECLNAGMHHPAEITALIREHHHDLYVAILEERGDYMVQQWVAEAVRLQKVIERNRSQRDRIAAKIAEGRTEYLELANVVSVFGLRVFEWRMGDMTREDHLLAADAYYALADQNRHYGKVHAEIARKLKKGQRTEDRFTEAELRDLYRPYNDTIEEAKAS